MIPLAFDMDTGDPDDAVALCLTAEHLGWTSVTVTLGSGKQGW